jgi:hypothetical protein
LAVPGWHARQHCLAPAVWVRFWRLRRGLLEPLPAMAFCEDTCDGFGPDTRLRLVLHRRDDVLDVFGGVVAILIHFVLLCRSAACRTSATGTILETHSPPGLPAIHPSRHAPLVDLREAGNRRDGRALMTQQEAMGSHTGASCGMMGMHRVQGLDCGVAQGGDILHRVCSLSISGTKAHWDTQWAGTKERSDPRKIRPDFIPKLMS